MADAQTRVEAVISGRDEFTPTLNVTINEVRKAERAVVETNQRIDQSAQNTRKAILNVKQALPGLVQGIAAAGTSASGVFQAAAASAIAFGGTIGAIGGTIATLIVQLRATAREASVVYAKLPPPSATAMDPLPEWARYRKGIPPGTTGSDLRKMLDEAAVAAEQAQEWSRKVQKESAAARAGTLKALDALREGFTGFAALVEGAGKTTTKFFTDTLDKGVDAAKDRKLKWREFEEAFWSDYAEELAEAARNETNFRQFVQDADRAYWTERIALETDAAAELGRLHKETFDDWIAAIEEITPGMALAFRETFAEIRKDLQDNVRLATEVIRGFQGAIKQGFDHLFESIVQGSFRAGEALRNLGLLVLRALLGTVSTQASLGVTSLFGSLFGRAAGGPVHAGQAYVVGERRPELFIPNRSGRIESSVAGAGGGAGITVNANIQAVDAASFAALAARNPEALTGAVLRVISSQPLVARAFRGSLA